MCKLLFVGLAVRTCLSLWERCPQGGEGPLSRFATVPPEGEPRARQIPIYRFPDLSRYAQIEELAVQLQLQKRDGHFFVCDSIREKSGNRTVRKRKLFICVSGIVRQGGLDFLMQIPFPDTVVADGNCLGAILIHEKRQQQDTGHQRVNPFRLIEQDQIYSILIVFAQASGQRFQLLPVEGSAVLRQRRNRSLRFS